MRIDADALRVTLGDEAAILDDGDRPRAPGWLTRQLGKGAIECRGKLRVLRRHHRGTRDFGKQSGRRLATRHGDIDERFAMIERTAKSVAVHGAVAAQTEKGNRDIPGRAVHPVIHRPGNQPAARDRIPRFGKDPIGVEPGDEAL